MIPAWQSLGKTIYRLLKKLMLAVALNFHRLSKGTATVLFLCVDFFVVLRFVLAGYPDAIRFRTNETFFFPETSPKQRRIHLTRAPCRKNPQDSEVERIYSRLRATFLVLKGSQKAGAKAQLWF